MPLDEQNKPEHSSAQEPPSTTPPNTSDDPIHHWGGNQINLDEIARAVSNVRQELKKVIIGQDELIDLLIAAILADGHVLLEGVPGIAKTLTAKLMAKTMEAKFSRIQFTPDLMPSDVVGTTIFNMKTSDFSFSAGPVFANIILIDEINRAPAKTQAALFEVMEEHQVTVDGVTHSMEEPFLVMATQNPIEQEGTYKLPEAQLDRFLMKINLSYPNLEEEKGILKRFKSDFRINARTAVDTVISKDELRKCRNLTEKVHIEDTLLDYIATIVHTTRNHGDLFLGASPRASLAILRMAKAISAMGGRDFVTPDDIQLVTYPVLNHRIILQPEREMEGYDTKDIIASIIQSIEVPR